MAISETSLRDVVLMAVDEINAKGGVMGKKIEPVVVDPTSNWPLFAEKAKQLIIQEKVAVTFGCWTSVSRKSVLPVFEGNTETIPTAADCSSTRCSTRARSRASIVTNLATEEGQLPRKAVVVSKVSWKNRGCRSTTSLLEEMLEIRLSTCSRNTSSFW